MAEAVAQGCGGTLFTAEEFGSEQVGSFDALPSDASPWARNSWRKPSLTPCSKAVSPICRARNWPCSAPMAWETENGCAIGNRNAGRQELLLAAGSVIRQDDPEPLLMIAGPWARRAAIAFPHGHPTSAGRHRDKHPAVWRQAFEIKRRFQRRTRECLHVFSR